MSLVKWKFIVLCINLFVTHYSSSSASQLTMRSDFMMCPSILWELKLSSIFIWFFSSQLQTVNESGTWSHNSLQQERCLLWKVVYACGVPTCMCVYMWTHVCIGYIYMWNSEAGINDFSVPLYFTYWGNLSHLKPELYNLTNVVNKLAPETLSVLLHVGVTSGMP